MSAHLNPWSAYQHDAWGQPAAIGVRTDRVVRWLTTAMVVALLAIEARPPKMGPDVLGGGASGGPLFLQEYLVVAMVTTSVLTRRVRRDLPPGTRRALFITWLMVFWGAVVLLTTSFLSVPVAPGAWGNVRMLAEGAAVFLAVSQTRWVLPQIERLLFAFVVVGALHASVVWAQFLVPGAIPFDTVAFDGTGEARFSGLFLQPSRAGFIFAIAMALALALMLESRSAAFVRWVSCLAFPVLGVGVLLTQTRGSILAAGAGVFFVLWRNRRYLALCGSFLIAVAALLSGGMNRLDVFRVGLARFGIGDPGAGVGRSEVYFEVWKFLTSHPLGGGAGHLYDFSGYLKIPHAHNMYLQVAVMFGLPGLVLFVWWFWSVVKDYSAHDGGVSMIAMRGGLVSAAVAFMTEPFLITNVGVWFWVLAALAICPKVGAERTERPIQTI